MKIIKISVQKRTELGKKSTRDLRNQDHVPCVLYGGAEVLHFHAHENDFRHIIYTPTAYIVELDIEGELHKGVMQDIQFHPVTDKLLHIDFVEVFEDKPVTVELPLNLVGAAIGLKDGGKQRQRRRVLKVRGLIKDLPETLDIDVTNVGIGDTVKIGDLSYDNLEILDPKRSMIYSIVSSRVSMKGMELIEPEEAEAAEGEAVEGEVAEGEAAEGGEGDEAKAEEGADS